MSHPGMYAKMLNSMNPFYLVHPRDIRVLIWTSTCILTVLCIMPYPNPISPQASRTALPPSSWSRYPLYRWRSMLWIMQLGLNVFKFPKFSPPCLQTWSTSSMIQGCIQCLFRCFPYYDQDYVHLYCYIKQHRKMRQGHLRYPPSSKNQYPQKHTTWAIVSSACPHCWRDIQ